MKDHTEEDEVTLKEMITHGKKWYSYILSKWKILLLFGLLGGGVGMFISVMKKPLYTASLTFVLEDPQTGEMAGALGVASMLGFDISGGGGMFSGANLIELFKSRNIVEKTLLSPVSADPKAISFAEMYIDAFGYRNKWAENDALKNIHFLPFAERNTFSRSQDSILGTIYESITQNSLKVELRDKKTDIINIEMQSENENFAKYFTDALVKKVSDFYISTKNKKALINLGILEKQTDSVRAQLNNAITGVAVAGDNTFGLNPALNLPRVPSSRKQVDVQANTGILMELIKQTEVARVMVRKSTPLIQIIDEPIFPLKKQKLGKLKSIITGGFIGGLIALFILVLMGIVNKLKHYNE
jgi:uncharacterized protein involved in exopolysaccharide biosynthesis